MDINRFSPWLNRTEKSQSLITEQPMKGLLATLDHNDTRIQKGSKIHSASHWLYFLPSVQQSLLAKDGHPQKGSFLPPVELPRRMWAGSSIEYFHDVFIGDDITKTSKVEDIIFKEGTTGPLIFIKVKHIYASHNRIAIIESQDIVYRDLNKNDSNAQKIPPPPADPDWIRVVDPTPTLLFRYSALTFNAHRIHYDRNYAQEIEGYPGLVVHGPLIATLLLDLVEVNCPQSKLSQFSFRSVQPLTDSSFFKVCGKRGENVHLQLWVENAEGQLTTTASATLR